MKSISELKSKLVHYQTGERKHEDAAQLLPLDASFEGIFAIFCSRAVGCLKKHFAGDKICAIMFFIIGISVTGMSIVIQQVMLRLLFHWQ